MSPIPPAIPPHEQQALLTGEQPPILVAVEKKRPYLWISVVLLTMCAVVFFGWSPIKHRYQRWGAARQVARAEAFLVEKDFGHALLDARAVLEVEPMNIRATVVMAKAYEALGSPVAVSWRNRLDSLQVGDAENSIAWATGMLKNGDAFGAERILKTVKPTDQGTAEFHAAAARIDMAKRDLASAEQHWADASRLQPEDDGYRLELAMIRLGSKRADERRNAVEILSEISRKPPKSIVALRTLLTDATGKGEWDRAVVLADALVADPGVTFTDKLIRLKTLRTPRLSESSAYLEELRAEALSNPENLYLLFMWMNQNDLAMMVSEWSRTLPADLIFVPPASVGVADAFDRGSEWKKLKEYVEDRTWGEMDYLRRAFLARALDRMGDTEGAAQEWKDAVSAIRGKKDARNRLERIARVAINWKWYPRAEEVMWTMAGMPDCPRWVLGGLSTASLKRGDAGSLQKIAGVLVQADSKSPVNRNTYAFFSLLVHSEEGNPHLEAEKLFNENPADAQIAVTRGLSLFQQGKIAEALAITNGLPPEELHKPQVALYHAIFLTSAGETAKAAEFLSVAKDWKMFPEEKALLDRAKAMISKAANEKDVAEAARVAKAARIARELEMAKAVEAAKAERAAKAAQVAKSPNAADEKDLAEALKAKMAERAARAVEAEAAVAAARAARAKAPADAKGAEVEKRSLR